MFYDNILFFDTETTGLPPKGCDPVTDFERYPHIVQISWSLNDRNMDFIIKPDGWTIPPQATAIHGITNEDAQNGVKLDFALRLFSMDLIRADKICAHNADFDIGMIISNAARVTEKCGRVLKAFLNHITCIDTMMLTIDFVGACFPDGTPGKYPKLEELYYKLFNETFPAHNSMQDVLALKRCYYELIKQDII